MEWIVIPTLDSQMALISLILLAASPWYWAGRLLGTKLAKRLVRS